MVFLYIFLFCILAIIALTDIRKGLIPDVWVGGVALMGFLHEGITHLPSMGILGLLGYGLYKLYPLLKKREGLGLGDVKLMMACGAWLPLEALPLFLMITGSTGVLTALLWRFFYKQGHFPLGPALAFALGVCILPLKNLSAGEPPMSPPFSGPTLLPAAGGKPESIVVLLHGYGATGDDLLALGKSWAPLLPHTLFIAPHAPFVCEAYALGKQWFGLKDWEFPRILKEVQDIAPALNHYLDSLLKLYNLPPEKLALVGFSQGAMMALHLALLRPPCGAIVAYSGALVEDPQEIKMAKPPILLIHGREDPVLNASFSEEAEIRLRALGVPLTLSLLAGLGHSIDERGLTQGGEFLKEAFNARIQP